VCHRLIVPVTLPDRDLDWRVYEPPTDRPAPALSPLGVTAIRSADLIIVPALAVDRAGIRLGRGGGSYDRALARVPAGIPIVAAVYADEFVESLPGEAHDRRVTAVVTSDGLTRV
jgi:5-formyltetrahydrofolate cyclo-ligase